ncbi:hypothetical protein ACFE04_005685 [Oxalis oulophora]
MKLTVAVIVVIMLVTSCCLASSSISNRKLIGAGDEKTTEVGRSSTINNHHYIPREDFGNYSDGPVDGDNGGRVTIRPIHNSIKTQHSTNNSISPPLTSPTPASAQPPRPLLCPAGNTTVRFHLLEA